MYTNRPNHVVLFAVWLALALMPGVSGLAEDTSPNSAAMPSGTISGRVHNAVTGNYLNKARISVKGTEHVVFTDESGLYRIVGLPSGPAVLEVFYTDLDPQVIAVNVPAGQGVEQNISLTSKSRYGAAAATDLVQLKSFVVSAQKETEGNALATNEQRFAPNIKNVFAVDSSGDVRGDGVGDFLKSLPGLVADYSGDEIVGISARGFGTEMTTFSIDGEASITATPATTTRQFRLLTPSLSTVSRIEITKVPLPSTPADSLGGAINLISKSAFERGGAQFKYSVSMVGNSENLTFGRTPSSYDKLTYKIQPNVGFDYTLPINRNLGLVISGTHTNRYNPQNLTTASYSAAGAGTGASFDKPYLQSTTLANGPRSQENNSGGIKVDWRVTRNSVLSAEFQAANYYIEGGFLNWLTNAGTVGTPTPTNLPNPVNFSYGDNYVIGASGRGAVTMNPTAATGYGKNNTVALNYRFDNGRWRVEAGASRTRSAAWSDSIPRGQDPFGQFSSIAISLRNPVRVSYSNITADRPGSIKVYDNANNEVDIYNLDNYQLTAATTSAYDNTAVVTTANANVRRSFDWLAVPVAAQIGVRENTQTRDTKRGSATVTYNGPDGNPATADSPTPYAMQLYKPNDDDYGFKNEPYVSSRRMYQAWQRNPVLFTETDPQKVAEENFRITNSQRIEESVDALYLQIEAHLVNNRLGITTGVRYEKTTDRGAGALVDPNAVFQRDAKGFFLHDAAGAKIRKPEAGAVGSMAELLLVRKERAALANRSYDGYYPSVHLTYNLTENFLVRAAYAKTYGRPALINIIPTTTIAESDLTQTQLGDPNAIPGTLTVSNTGLRPWSADNYDLSIEYYTNQGGVFSAGVFDKEIRDFFSNQVRIATAADIAQLGLPPQYVGWQISSAFNSGNARITGAEFNLRQSLQPLGGWGRYFSVFANWTKLKLEGDRLADFSGFTPDSGNWGLTFDRSRFSVTAKWNYAGLRRRGALPALGADAYEYWKPQTRLDASVSYQLAPNLRLFTSFNNLLNQPQTLLHYGSQTPAYAQQFRRAEYGVAISVGLKGQF